MLRYGLAMIVLVGATASVQAGVILDAANVAVDYGDEAGQIEVVSASEPDIAPLTPVPGWTGVKVSNLDVTWKLLQNSPVVQGFQVVLDGTANGTVITDRVLFEWSDIQVTGPGAGDIYDYGIWFFGYYDDNTGGQAEGYGAAFPESSNGSFWLDTSVGSANSAQMVKWTMRVEVHLAENAPIGEYSLRIGGNSIDAGTKSILSAVPEPSSAVLWGLGSMVVAALVRLRSRRVRG